MLHAVMELGFKLFDHVVKLPTYKDQTITISPLGLMASLLVAMNGSSNTSYKGMTLSSTFYKYFFTNFFIDISSKLGFADLNLDLPTINGEIARSLKHISSIGVKFANDLWVPTKGTPLSPLLSPH